MDHGGQGDRGLGRRDDPDAVVTVFAVQLSWRCYLGHGHLLDGVHFCGQSASPGQNRRTLRMGPPWPLYRGLAVLLSQAPLDGGPSALRSTLIPAVAAPA